VGGTGYRRNRISAPCAMFYLLKRKMFGIIVDRGKNPLIWLCKVKMKE
jgi:hypothetical protein